MATKGPDDGWAYSPIELTAIWNIPVTEDDIRTGLERRWRWFRHSGDVTSTNILTQSLIADMDDLDRAAHRETT